MPQCRGPPCPFPTTRIPQGQWDWMQETVGFQPKEKIRYFLLPCRTPRPFDLQVCRVILTSWEGMGVCGCYFICLPQNALTDNSGKLLGMILPADTVQLYQKSYFACSAIHSIIRWLPITSITNLFSKCGCAWHVAGTGPPYLAFSQLISTSSTLAAWEFRVPPSLQQHSPYCDPFLCSPEPRPSLSSSSRPSSITPLFSRLSQHHLGRCPFNS